MAIASDIVAQGTLTGAATVDTLHTGAGTEFLVVTFRNYTDRTTPAAVTLDVFVNGTADGNVIYSCTLAAGETLVWRQKLGNTDTARAEAGAASSISYMIEQDTI